MIIQSLSVVVPNKHCVNSCEFCVSKMHKENFDHKLNINNSNFSKYLKEFTKRIQFARDNECNSVILTGTSEPQQNTTFLNLFGLINNSLQKPFRNIELQTSGVFINDESLRFLKEDVGVTTISLSLASFVSEEHYQILNAPIKLRKISIEEIAKKIKDMGINLRLSLNFTQCFDRYINEEEQIFHICKERFFADQLTFRVLFSEGNEGESEWVRKNSCSQNLITNIKAYIRKNGTQLEKTEYGYTKYSINGMSSVIDDDCMNTVVQQAIKYLILREDCKLYSRWNDIGSLIF